MTGLSILSVLFVASFTGVQSDVPIWMVAIGHDYGAYQYLDSSGFVAGFYRDVVSEACAAANMDCRTIWAPYTDCYESLAGQHPRGTVGMMGHWFDACEGWAETVTRRQIFSFSKPYMDVVTASFGVLATDTTFDPTNLSGKKIGFVDGWANDEKCLARQNGISGVPLQSAFIIHVPTSVALQQALLDGTVDAIFSSIVWTSEPLIKTLPTTYNCVITGAAMMTRKDSLFNQNFNQGMDKIMTNGVYSRLCAQAAQTHGHKGTVDCVI